MFFGGGEVQGVMLDRATAPRTHEVDAIMKEDEVDGCTLLEAEADGQEGSFPGANFRTRSVGLDEGKRARICTDLIALIFFIAYLFGMSQILSEARVWGNIDKLTHGFDWRGHICGVENRDGSDSDVMDKPFLYWCARDTEHLALTDGICVKECPGNRSTLSPCPDAPHVFDYDRPLPGTGVEKTMGFRRNLTMRNDYPTTEVFGYCLPTDQAEAKLMEQILEQTPLAGGGEKVFSAMTGISESKFFLIGVAICAIIAGYLFLFVMKAIIGPFIIALMGLIMLMFVSAFAYFLLCSFIPDYNIYSRVTADEGNAKVYALSTSGVLFALTIVYTCVICNARTAIEVTIQSIEESADVLVEMPTLLLQPLGQVLLKLLALGFLLDGLMWVVSLGDVHVNVDFDPFNPDDYTMKAVSGLSRSVRFTSKQQGYIAAWIFGSMWIIEVINALGSFALSHAVVCYKWLGQSVAMPLSRGYLNAIMFHLGSIALGAFVIAVLKFITALVAWMTKQIQSSDASGEVNVVAKVILYCCNCCLGCMVKILELINEMVYTEIAISGRNYCASSGKVYKLLLTNPIVLGTLKGTTYIVRALGLMLIGGGGTYISYKFLSDSSWQSAADNVTSSVGLHGLSHILVTTRLLGSTVAAGLICFAIAESFMQIFDHTAQTLTYCILCKKQKDPQFETPESWRLAGHEEQQPYRRMR